MHVTVKKWGNSESVRIPVAIMEAVNLSLNEIVDMHEEGGRIVIEPIRNVKEYDLAQLIAGDQQSAALADQVKSLDWVVRKATPEGKVSSGELAEVKAKIFALTGKP